MSKLFIPGPVNVEEPVLAEMSRPLIGHRTEEFKELHKQIVDGLKELLETKKNVFLMTCSATGAMESAIRNIVSNRVLCLANGAFGRRWFEIAELNGKAARLLDFGDGAAFDLVNIENELKAQEYDAVTVVLNETSTGIENNLEGLKTILKCYPDLLLLVDAVTGIFGTAIDLEGIDVLVFGTQKALALPPGLAVTLVEDRAINRARNIKNRGYYSDFIKMSKKAEMNFTVTTPNISLMYALKKRLDVIKDTGIDEWIKKHKNNAELVREFFRKNGFGLFIDEKNKSKTVTVVENSKDIDVPALIESMKTRGYSLANGYGKLRNKTFRIGHMGVDAEETAEMLADIKGLI